MKVCDKCNRLLKETKDWSNNLISLACPVHKGDYKGKEIKRNKIGRYSGKSKNEEYGRNKWTQH